MQHRVLCSSLVTFSLHKLGWRSRPIVCWTQLCVLSLALDALATSFVIAYQFLQALSRLSYEGNLPQRGWWTNSLHLKIVLASLHHNRCSLSTSTTMTSRQLHVRKNPMKFLFKNSMESLWKFHMFLPTWNYHGLCTMDIPWNAIRSTKPW